MTLLAQLIEAASNDDTSTATLLRQVKVIASRAGTVELEAWVEHELNGYPVDAALPDYRGPFNFDVAGTVIGPGGGLKNAPIPPSSFPRDMREGQLFVTYFNHSIAELEELARSDDNLKVFWSGDAIALTNALIQSGEVELYRNTIIQQAFLILPPSRIVAAVDTVRNRVLDLALSLERLAPDAGEPGAPAPSTEHVDTLVMHVYGSAPNIAVASSNFNQAVIVPSVGDSARLFDILRELGYDDAAIEELHQALEEDEASGQGGIGTGIGPRVAQWMARAAAQGTSAVAKGAAAGVGLAAIQAIGGYFGVL